MAFLYQVHELFTANNGGVGPIVADLQCKVGGGCWLTCHMLHSRLVFCGDHWDIFVPDIYPPHARQIL